MRASILVLSFVAALVFGVGCGSNQDRGDTGPADRQDAARPDPRDSAGLRDGLATVDQFSATTIDSQNAARVDGDAPPSQDGGAGLETRDVAAADLRDSAAATDGPRADLPMGAEAEAGLETRDVAAADLRDSAAATDGPRADLPMGAEAGTSEAGSNPWDLASSPLPREIAELSATEKSELATSLSGFAFALWQELRKDPSTTNNFAFSPTSLSLALGMAYAGARANTASQMKDAMQVAGSSEAYLRSLNWLDQQLASRAGAALKEAQDAYKPISGGPAPDPANYRLHVINDSWGERTMTFERPYLDTLATNFGSGVHLADFATQPEAERLAINGWVAQETLDRIKDLIPRGAIDASTRLVLANAIHLKLPWFDPFRKENTQPGTFTKTDGSTVSVSFMNREGGMLYMEDESVQVGATPLAGGSINFVVFLPKPTASLAQLEDTLSQTRAQSLMAGMKSQQVTFALPSFVFTTPSVSLRSALAALGMTDAFSPNADFTGITREMPLTISDVRHKAMIGVDEQGVEAAAATVILVPPPSIPPKGKDLIVNRPFFFGIYDSPSSTWLFLGHVTDPSS